MDAKDIYYLEKYFYTCVLCNQRYFTWWMPDDEWYEVVGLTRQDEKECAGLFGPDGMTICKECFEELAPNPHYCTADKYFELRVKTWEDLTREDARERHMRVPKESERNKAFRAKWRSVFREFWDIPGNDNAFNEGKSLKNEKRIVGRKAVLEKLRKLIREAKGNEDKEETEVPKQHLSGKDFWAEWERRKAEIIKSFVDEILILGEKMDMSEPTNNRFMI